MSLKPLLGCCLITLISSLCHAETITSEVFDNNGHSLGTIVFQDSAYGLLISPKLSMLPAGIHGFHIHQHPNCANHGMDAGGHLDPEKTNSHQGPYGHGHLGDLPILVVSQEGNASLPTLAPRLKTQDIKGHAIMIHEGGDNYTDNPALGGGGSRIACGKIL